ncbi:MAG TPA: phytanoyl-CoA dioxygenase family protein [Streptosporangiaceae bacterium]
MLTHQQVFHFCTFGYLTLRGLFSPSEIAALRDEVTTALTDAFGRLGAEPDESGGISGDDLAADRAPFGQSTVADDERTFLTSAELLGPARSCIGLASQPVSPAIRPGTHAPAIPGLTIWVDLEPRTARTGALRLVPGSQIPDYERRLWAYCRAAPGLASPSRKWSHVVVETEPRARVSVSLRGSRLAVWSA